MKGTRDQTALATSFDVSDCRVIPHIIKGVGFRTVFGVSRLGRETRGQLVRELAGPVTRHASAPLSIFGWVIRLLTQAARIQRSTGPPASRPK